MGSGMYCSRCIGTGVCGTCDGEGRVDGHECGTCLGSRVCGACRGNGRIGGGRTARSSGLRDLSSFREELKRPPRNS